MGLDSSDGVNVAAVGTLGHERADGTPRSLVGPGCTDTRSTALRTVRIVRIVGVPRLYTPMTKRVVA